MWEAPKRKAPRNLSIPGRPVEAFPPRLGSDLERFFGPFTGLVELFSAFGVHIFCALARANSLSEKDSSSLGRYLG